MTPHPRAGALLLATLAGLWLTAAATPAAAQGTSIQIPRTDLATLQSVRPVGQQLVVRLTWGKALGETKTPGCLSFQAHAPGEVPAADALPTGVFVQLSEGNAGLVQGLQPGDQVDVIGLAGWANCASTRAQDMGWMALTPTQVTRVSKVGEPAPPEPALDFGGSATAAPATPATPAEPVVRGYAAKVLLVDGNTLSGQVVEETLESITVVVAGQEMHFDKDQVARIERTDAPEATPPKAEAKPEPKPVKEAPPPKPKKSAADKEKEKELIKSVIKTSIGGGLLVPAAIFLPNGGLYLGGGIARATGGPLYDLPQPVQVAARNGLWPAGVAGFWGGGIPMMIVGIELLRQGIDGLQAHQGTATAHQRVAPRVSPWAVTDRDTLAFGISGEF